MKWRQAVMVELVCSWKMELQTIWPAGRTGGRTGQDNTKNEKIESRQGQNMTGTLLKDRTY